jgi:hypothetical protein
MKKMMKSRKPKKTKNRKRRFESMFNKEVVKNSIVGGLSFIGSLMLPKALKITDWKKYAITGGVAVLSMTLGKKVLGKNASSVAVGAGVATAVNLINDFILKRTNQAVLAEDLSAEGDALDLISAGGELPIMDAGEEEIQITD